MHLILRFISKLIHTLVTYRNYSMQLLIHDLISSTNGIKRLLRWRVMVRPWWRHQMKTFSALLAMCAGIHRSPVSFSHKGQRCGALMFSLICAWINHCVNNGETGDLRRYRAHYDVIVMHFTSYWPGVIIPHAQRSCWGVYWFHSVRPSVRLSVRPSRIPCPLCSVYSFGWIHFIFIHLIKQLQKVCRV